LLIEAIAERLSSILIRTASRAVGLAVAGLAVRITQPGRRRSGVMSIADPAIAFGPARVTYFDTSFQPRSDGPR
jgi:hypothetical protein